MCRPTLMAIQNQWFWGNIPIAPILNKEGESPQKKAADVAIVKETYVDRERRSPSTEAVVAKHHGVKPTLTLILSIV